MTAEDPKPERNAAWKQAASRPLGKRLVWGIIAGAIAAITYGAWEMGRNFAILESNFTSNFAETPVKAQAPMGPDSFKFHIVWHNPEVVAAATTALAVSVRSATPLAERYRVLGELKSIGDCTIDDMDMMNGASRAEVRCPAVFAVAPATIRLSMIRSGSDWKVAEITVTL